MSVSRKSVWDECKKKYHFKYHLKVESEEPEPFYFTYGKIVHKIAEEYVRCNGKNNINEISNLVLGGKILIDENTIAPNLPLEYKLKFPNHIKAIDNITNKIGFDGELEWDFKYDLDPPNEKYVIGFIDRLIRKKDNFFILDYKTTKKGKFRKNQQTIKSDLQLRTYARIVQKQFNVPAENINTALYYLEGGDLISLESAEKILLESYNSILSSDPDKVWGTVGNHCTRCEYSKMCPFFSK